MKKTMFVLLVVIFFLSTLSGLTFADLEYDAQQVIKDFIIDYDAEVTEANFSDLEGIEYEIVYEADYYIIVKVEGRYVIVPVG